MQSYKTRENIGWTGSATGKKSESAVRGELTLDAIDWKILSALSANGRLTMNELAEKVGLSQSSCWIRVKRLESGGAIESYAAVLNHKVMGVPNIVFVEVTSTSMMRGCSSS